MVGWEEDEQMRLGSYLEVSKGQMKENTVATALRVTIAFL